MPSKAISSSVQMRAEAENESSWTDGFSKCTFSGIGSCPNETYKNGLPYCKELFEDCSINVCLDEKNNTYLYGVFDGHEGSRAARFMSEGMAQLSCEILDGKHCEVEVKNAFYEAFMSVENMFMESIDPQIAKRTQLLEQIPRDLVPQEAAKLYPDIYNRLMDLDQEIRGGTACAIALVYNGFLHIGNVGNVRILLGQKDKSGVLKVRQLSVDHTTNSFDEIQRLSLMSVHPEKVKGTKFGCHDLTRCIGNYSLKRNYAEFEPLRSATGEPITAEPYILSLPLDNTCSFLLMMSHGLYKCYEEATGLDRANKEIATMVIEQMREQQNLDDVAQTVVDQIVRLHREQVLNVNPAITKREDITLLVRNFYFPFPRVINENFMFSDSSVPNNLNQVLNDIFVVVEKMPRDSECLQFFLGSGINVLCKRRLALLQNAETEHIEDMNRLSIVDDINSHITEEPRRFYSSAEFPERQSNAAVHPSGNTTSTESSKLSNPSLTQLTLNEHGLIESYVDFDVYYKTLESAVENGSIPISKMALFK